MLTAGQKQLVGLHERGKAGDKKTNKFYLADSLLPSEPAVYADPYGVND